MLLNVNMAKAVLLFEPAKFKNSLELSVATV